MSYFEQGWLSNQPGEFQVASMSKLCLAEHLPGHRQSLERKFTRDQVAVHMGYRCSGCGHKPLIGARFSCNVCDTHFCGHCFNGRAHAHSPQHQFTAQDFPLAVPTDAHVAPQISQGSKVVVIGTGKEQLDGQLGVVTSAAPTSGALPLWSVLVEGSEAMSLEAQHLFLRGQATPKASRELEAPLDKSVEPAPEAKDEPKEGLLAPTPPSPQKKAIASRFTLVGSGSLHELRQVEGQEAGVSRYCFTLGN